MCSSDFFHTYPSNFLGAIVPVKVIGYSLHCPTEYQLAIVRCSCIALCFGRFVSSATSSVANDGKFFRTSKMPMRSTEHQDAFVWVVYLVREKAGRGKALLYLRTWRDVLVYFCKISIVSFLSVRYKSDGLYCRMARIPSSNSFSTPSVRKY